MKIALFDAFPLVPFNAERELIARCLKVFAKLGHKAISVSTSGEVAEFNPDIVLCTHERSPKLTEHFTIGALWSPTLFYKDNPELLRNIRSWDLIIPIDEAIRQFAIDLHFPVRHRTAVSKHVIYPSAQVVDVPLPAPTKLSLAYVGVQWDGGRHEALFTRLADEVDLRVYGPEEAWGFIHAAYGGPIPFDGNALFETLNGHGAVLAFHKESHRREDTPSMRCFEACAAKCFVITDLMPSLQHLFGDNFSYVDMDAGVDQAVQQIKLALDAANREREKTTARIEAAHRFFRERVSLDALLPAILDEAEARISQKRSIAARAVDAPTVSVIIRCGRRPLRMISRAVDSIKRQLYPRISLIFARFAPIEGFDRYVDDLRKSNRFDDIEVLDVGGAGGRSESLWTGLRAVKTPFFSILDDDDEWFPDHLHHLMEIFERDESVDLAHSGAIRHDEEGHSPHLHTRLRRSDGTWLDERRVLSYCQAQDIGQLLKGENSILPNSILARSELLVAEVLEDPQLDVMQDIYLYLLLIARGARFAFNGRATAIWNWRVQSRDNSWFELDLTQCNARGERIARRLGQYQFPGYGLGETVIGWGNPVGTDPVAEVVSQIPRYPREIVYKAELDDQILLHREGRPSCLSSMKGLSYHEDWGRWTDGDCVELVFWHPLPKSFEFEFVTRPAPTMVGKNVTIGVGSFSKVITFENANLGTYRVPVKHHNGANTIIMQIANPVSPAEAAGDPDGDQRRLGIALTSFRIVPKRKFSFA